MSTSRTTSIDQLLAQGLRERAAGGSDDLLEQIVREAASTPQQGTQLWRSGIQPGRLVFLASLGILVALAGAIAIGTGLVRLPAPPRMPQYHHNGVLLVVSGGGLISQDVEIGEADPATEIVPPGHHNVFDVSWAPDGSRLVFSAADGVFVAGAADGIPTEISRCGPCGVAYSPDGSTIALAGGSDLHLLSLESGVSRDLVREENDSLSAPTWSPDSRRLAFVARSPSVSGNESATLYVVDRDGSHLVALADAAPPNTAILDAAWSPDGSEIAYILTSDSSTRLTAGWSLTLDVINPDGSGRARLADAGACTCQGANSWPNGLTWSPDGSRIALGRPQDGTYLMNRDGTNPQKVFDLWGPSAWRPVP